MNYPDDYETPTLVFSLRLLAWLGLSAPLLVLFVFAPGRQPLAVILWAVLCGVVWLLLCLAVASALDALWLIEHNIRRRD